MENLKKGSDLPHEFFNTEGTNSKKARMDPGTATAASKLQVCFSFVFGLERRKRNMLKSFPCLAACTNVLLMLGGMYTALDCFLASHEALNIQGHMNKLNLECQTRPPYIAMHVYI